MGEAIADTGPILHLHEIDQVKALGIFSHLIMPDLVVKELRAYNLDLPLLDVTGLNTSIIVVAREQWAAVTHEANEPSIHPADAQVFTLAQSNQFRLPVLTDDLALRRRLETRNATVIGSVGILVRAYTTGLLNRNELENFVEALCTTSSLHMSSPFIAYVRQLITNLP